MHMLVYWSLDSRNVPCVDFVLLVDSEQLAMHSKYMCILQYFDFKIDFDFVIHVG